MNWRENNLVKKFHNLYYNGPKGEEHLYKKTFWMGVTCWKCPLDMWIYQEMIAELKPDLIVETGTNEGGSALFLAHMMDIVGKGEIITIDIVDHPARPKHPRINYVIGSSTDEALLASLLDERPSDETRLVILDSDHEKGHVLKEMNLLAPHVSRGSYLIVEDTNVNGHPTFPAHGPGPYEAVEKFLKTNKQFEVDRSREKFLMTFNPMGYLRRVA